MYFRYEDVDHDKLNQLTHWQFSIVVSHVVVEFGYFLSEQGPVPYLHSSSLYNELLGNGVILAQILISELCWVC